MNPRQKTLEVPFSSSWLWEPAVPIYGALAIGFAALVLSGSATASAAKGIAVVLCVGGLFSWFCGRWVPSPSGMTGAALSVLPVVVILWALVQLGGADLSVGDTPREVMSSESLTGVMLIGDVALLGATSFLWRALCCETTLACRDSVDQLALQAGLWLLLAGALALFGASHLAIQEVSYSNGAIVLTPPSVSAWRRPIQMLDASVTLAGVCLALVAYRRLNLQRRWVAEVLAGMNERWEIRMDSGPGGTDRLMMGSGATAEDFTIIVQERREDRGSYREPPEPGGILGTLPSNVSVLVSEVGRGLDRSVSMLLVVVCAPLVAVVLAGLWYWFGGATLILYGVVVGLCYFVDRLREETNKQ